MAIAEVLGWDEDQVLALSPKKYARWLAYFRVKAREERKQADTAQRKARAHSGARAGSRGRRS